MALSITHTPVYCTDLDEALAFYTQRLGFEVRDDVPMGPEMRWLTVHAPGDPHDLLLAAVDHHIPSADRQAMREIVAKGDLAVFIQVDDLDKTFESLRSAGAEILQDPVDQPYGVRDAAVRDPSGNHQRLSPQRTGGAGLRSSTGEPNVTEVAEMTRSLSSNGTATVMRDPEATSSAWNRGRWAGNAYADADRDVWLAVP